MYRLLVCYNNYEYYKGKCYRYYDLGYDWFEARQYCLDQGSPEYPVFLAEPGNADEDDYLATLCLNGNDREECAIGAQDQDQEGVWVWDSSGTRLITNYSNWANGEPDGNGDCGFRYAGDNGKFPFWHDTDCNRDAGFVCEFVPCTGDNCTVCNTIDITEVTPSSVTFNWSKPCTTWDTNFYQVQLYDISAQLTIRTEVKRPDLSYTQ